MKTFQEFILESHCNSSPKGMDCPSHGSAKCPKVKSHKTVEAIAAVQTAQTVVAQEVVLQSPIGAPSNIVVTQLSSGDIQVSWDPPTGVVTPER